MLMPALKAKRLSRKKPETPKSKIKDALRRLWLRSRERAAALKATGYCCAQCGAKQSKAKGREVAIEVHHIDGIDWDGVADLIRARTLPDPSRLMPLCKSCHDDIHARSVTDVEKAGQ
jgi:predicted HNH restriction endonuclease